MTKEGRQERLLLDLFELTDMQREKKKKRQEIESFAHCFTCTVYVFKKKNRGFNIKNRRVTIAVML